MSSPLKPVRIVRLAWLPLALLIGATTAAAQTVDQEPPAHISAVEGTVVLERDGQTDTEPASMPVLAGDRLRTQNGRAEVLFADGSTLHLDAHTTVDFQSDEVIRLLDGRVRVNIAGPSRRVAYRIDAPSAWVQITQPGEYRVSLVGGERAREVELAVLRGAAEIVNEDGTTRVHAGERAFAAAGAAPSQPYVFNSAAWDAFDQWSEMRREQRLGVVAEYVPDVARPYAAVLSSYGSWRHEPTYGHVWYPRVSYGWRPYFHGRWTHLRPFGWTWIGRDPWAWPTHHYGRWGFSAGVWFWIPGRHWSPAWVSWAYAPGYVSWCPLGWNNRPVFGFTSVVFRGRRYDPWHGWTVVPRGRFGSGFVNINVVNVTNLDGRTRSAFSIRDSSPEFRGRAVARTPIRVAGARTGYAVPRDGSAGGPRAAGREQFRGRGTTGAPLTGPGFPDPARAPRQSAAPRQNEPSAGSAASRAVPRSEPGAATGVDRSAPARVVPRTERAAPSGAVRRAPQGTEAPPASRPSAVPSRRAPQGGAAPQAAPSSAVRVPRTAPSPSAPPSPARSRAVPRSGGGGSAPPSAAGVERYSPPSSPAASRVPDGSIRRGPEQPPAIGPRAVPRGERSGPMGAPAGRSERGVGRSESAGRPGGGSSPSAAPSRPSAGPAPSRGGDRPAASSPSRSRGGQPASGGAARRSGGGRGGN